MTIKKFYTSLHTGNLKPSLLLILAGLVCNASAQTVVPGHDNFHLQDTGFEIDKVTGRQQEVKNKESTDVFDWGDFSWMQGNNRQKKPLLSGKYFTGSITIDNNYNYHFANPADHTNCGSTATFRSNEFNISFIEAGGEFYEPKSGARAKLLLQFGTRATGVPRNDNTPLRGQFDLYTALRYISEAYAGMHFNKWHGINVDLGLFKSYVGLLSYNNFENWNYQPSYTSDNTPWFFTGARLQAFPGTKLKFELWLINGWQTYAMFNEAPGLGFQVNYRPKENLSIVSSSYCGWDTPDKSDRFRFHTDNSLQMRYLNFPHSHFISKAAFSLTGDLGFESGGGVSGFNTHNAAAPAQYFMSVMAYNRFWFGPSQKLAFTLGGGYVHNPGRYLALLPAGNATVTQNPGDKMEGWDCSEGFQFMPNEYFTLGCEHVYRNMNFPYFSGHGGVTSPNGWNTPIGNPAGFTADLAKNENRLIVYTIIRF